MHFIDGGEVDDKILAVPIDDVRFEHIKDIDDVTEFQLDEIAFFFTRYKDLQFKYKNKPEKKLEIKKWGNKADAISVIKECQKRFIEKFGSDIKTA